MQTHRKPNRLLVWGVPPFLQHPPSKYFSTLDPFRVAPLGGPPFLQHPPPSKYFSTLDPFRVAPLGGPPFFATHPSKYFSTLKSPRMCLKKCGLLCPCSGGLARGTSVIAFVMEFVIAFVIQTLDQIHFTIWSTSTSETLLICIYAQEHTSIYIYTHIYI